MATTEREELRKVLLESIHQMEARAYRQLATVQKSLEGIQKARAIVMGQFDESDCVSLKGDIAELAAKVQALPKESRPN